MGAGGTVPSDARAAAVADGEGGREGEEEER